jgi:hypothetical protein
MMRSKMILGVLVAVVLSTVALAGPPMNGPHFNLNIIGAPKDKDGGNFDNPDRHTIMVDLNGHTNIYMQQSTTSDDFAVIDGDGTDGTARFELAKGYYEVYAVALGKPLKTVTITPNAEFDGQTGEEVFALGHIDLTHDKKPVWHRVTGMFLVTVTVDPDGAGPLPSTTYTNEWVFDIPELIDYWWDYNNGGCKLTQVRFYKVDEQPVP